MNRHRVFGGLALLILVAASGAMAQAPVSSSSSSNAPSSIDEAVAVLVPMKDSGVTGTLVLRQRADHVSLVGTITGLKPGLHGFHIHEFGDLSAADGSSAGGHYNPGGRTHGNPAAEERHAGDLGNIEALADSRAEVNLRVPGVLLRLLIGRSLVVHQDSDDFTSQPAGNSGPRLAVGVIGLAQAAPLVAPAGPAKKFDVNSASLQELQNLPGIDAATGARIMFGRPYRNFDDLSRNGLPLSTVEKLRDLITFGP